MKRDRKANRRYYLHRRLRKHLKLNVEHRYIMVPVNFTHTPQSLRYVNALTNEYNYLIQTEIPNG